MLRQRLAPDGDFEGETEAWAGFGVEGVAAGAALNRPSDPSFCRHGVLHVSSFVTCASAGHAALAARGARRAAYKLAAGVGLGLGLGLG